MKSDGTVEQVRVSRGDAPGCSRIWMVPSPLPQWTAGSTCAQKLAGQLGQELVAMTVPVAAEAAVVATAARPWEKGGPLHESSSKTAGGRPACLSVLGTLPCSICTSNNSEARTPR